MKNVQIGNIENRRIGNRLSFRFDNRFSLLSAGKIRGEKVDRSSVTQMEEDGFQLVRSKRRREPKRRPFGPCRPLTDDLPQVDLNIMSDDTSFAFDVFVEQVTSKLLRLAEEVRCSNYFTHNLLPCVKRFVNQSNECTNTDLELICYGLGNFGRCQIAAYQFALLVCLNSTLNFRGVHMYDPVFVEEERTVAGGDRFCFSLIETNEECRRTVHCPTLFYMPHCDRQLYDNLLAANWGRQLANVIILGNSLTRMRDTSLDSQMNAKLPHIAQCFDYLDEYLIRNDFKFTDVFNDTSIHVFNRTKLVNKSIQ